MVGKRQARQRRAEARQQHRAKAGKNSAADYNEPARSEDRALLGNNPSKSALDHFITTLNQAAILASHAEPIQKSVSDVLVFETPIDTVEYLRLELPAQNFGGTGMLRLEIPKQMIAR